MRERLLDDPAVAPIGLGARDSLRLEAGLCLYGHDLDETTTPVEAALEWAIAEEPPHRRRPRRRLSRRATSFWRNWRTGASRRRVGLRPEGRAPVREGTDLFADETDGEPVGTVTSGGFGPTVGAPVAMGYVDTALATTGTHAVRRTARQARRRVQVAACRSFPAATNA